MSLLSSFTAIALNTNELKSYGKAYLAFFKEFNKAEINSQVLVRYREVESLLSFCLTLDNYRNAVNGNF